MKESKAGSQQERRSFLSRLNVGAAAIAALTLGGKAVAQTKAAAAAPFVPARHDLDDWMDQIPGKHRLVFDATSEAGVGDALLYASNFMLVNRNDYGLKNEDLAVIIVVRHIATSYGFNDAMWSKYASALAAAPPAEGKQAPTANPSGRQINNLVNQGVNFAVCSMATRRLAGGAARISGKTMDEAFAELGANLMPNARLVPAGIVAVSRAQERGYTLVSL